MAKKNKEAKKEKRREYRGRKAQNKRIAKIEELKSFTREHSTSRLWGDYKKALDEGGYGYLKVGEEQVGNMLETIQKYQKRIDVESRYYKAIIREQSRTIEKLQKELQEAKRLIQELEKEAGKTGKFGERIDKITQNAGKDFKNMAIRAEAGFRGDKMVEKTGSHAANLKDPYERLLAQILQKRRIFIHPNRARALAHSPEFIAAFNQFFNKTDLSQSEVADLWNYHFGDGGGKIISDYGLSSDTEENWDYNSKSKVFDYKKQADYWKSQRAAKKRGQGN